MRSNPRRFVLDVLAAVAVLAATLALYGRTLQPDFGGPEDTPKFQFLGYVLGTAHPPGYPLYVLLSHLFVQLPIGTIAYRANLFSAVMAAIACALAYTIGRQLGVRRVVALGCALTVAAGTSFWRSAVFAEVYSLAAALVAGSVILLLKWDASRQVQWLLATIALLAVALGNHLLIVGVAPAFVTFVVLRDRRVLDRRLLLNGAVIIAAGFAQYGFILIRTLQGNTYLESRATNLSELVSVIRADRFAEMRFAFGAEALFTTNVPSLASWIGSELGLVGTVLLIVAVLYAVGRRQAGAGLVAGSAVGMLLMIVNMSGDLKGFVTPVMVLLWPLAGLGADALLQMVGKHSGRVGTALVALAFLALPAHAVTRNYADADQSGGDGTARFLRTMFGHLPGRAAMVTEDYWSDMAFEYYRATGEAGPWGIARLGLDPVEVRRVAAEGHRVFALGAGAAILSADGLWFARSPLPGVPLADWLESLPGGAVIVGATAFTPLPFDPASIGRPDVRRPGRPRTFEAFAFVLERPLANWRGDDVRATVDVDNAWIRHGLPGRATADSAGATIEVGGEVIARLSRGLVLAAFTTEGQLIRALEFPEGAVLQVEFQEALYELRGEVPCVDVTSAAWVDLAAISGRASIVATLNEQSSADILLEMTASSGPIRAETRTLMGDGVAVLDGGGPNGSQTSMVWRLTRNGSRRPLYRLVFDQVPAGARARLHGENPSLRLCEQRPARDLFSGRGDAVLRADFEHEAYFGPGWTAAERTSIGALRRAAGSATLLLPLPTGPSCALDLDGSASPPIQVTASSAASGVTSITLGPISSLRAARLTCGG